MVKIYYDHEEMDTSLLSVVDENEDKARRFQRLVNKTKRFVESVDLLTIRGLAKWDLNFKIKLDNYEKDLKAESEKRGIVIVGDTSAGKSSMLNLLFGEDIFPTSHLHTTSTICRIYAGEKREIIPWTQNMDKQAPVPWKDVSELKTWMKENITPKRKTSGASKRRTKKECPYKYVDVYLQTSFIKDPLFLVDTPGTGKDETISKQVLDYIENAAGLICVLNVANAGGIRERGLRDILKRIEDNSSRTMLGFNPENAIFVFNKMDTVPEEELDEVRIDLIEELREIWPKVPATNILFFSVHDVMKGSKADLEVLFGLINQMVDRSLSTKFRNCDRWLCSLLQRCQENPTSLIYTDHCDEQVERVKEKLKEIDIIVGEFEEELKTKVEQIRTNIAEKYQHRIHSHEVRSRLFNFHSIATIASKPGESWESQRRRKRLETKKNVERHVNEILISELSDIVKEELKEASIETLQAKKTKISESVSNLQFLEDQSENMDTSSQPWGMEAMLVGALGSMAAHRFLRPAASLIFGAAAITNGAWLATAGLAVGVGAVVYTVVQNDQRESQIPLPQLINDWIEATISSVKEIDTKAKVLRPVREYILACVVDGESRESAISQFNRESLERWWIQYRLQDLSLELSKSAFGNKISQTVTHYKKLLEKMTVHQKRRLILSLNERSKEKAKRLLKEVECFQ